jgi:hypothetical protein
MCEEADFVVWWNSMQNKVGREEKQIQGRPVLPHESLAPRIVNRIFPLIRLFLEKSSGGNSFWNGVHRVLSQLFPNACFTDPLVNFPDFVQELYSIRDVLDPVTPKGVINLISSHPNIQSFSFLFWVFPEAIGSLVMHSDTIFELYSQRHNIWNSFVQTQGLIDRLLDKYMPLLGKPPDSMISLLCGIFRDYNTYSHKPKRHFRLFIRRLIFLVEVEHSAVAFYSSIQLLGKPGPLIRERKRLNFVLELISAVPHPSPFRYAALNFGMTCQSPKFHWIHFIKVIIGDGDLQPRDFSIIEEILLGKVFKKPDYALRWLCKLSFTDKVWSRVALTIFIKCLRKWSSLEGFMVWMVLYIRRVIVFWRYMYIRKLQWRRQAMIQETLDKLLATRIEWLRKAISVYFSSAFGRLCRFLVVDRLDNVDLSIGDDVDRHLKRSLPLTVGYLEDVKLERDAKMPAVLVQKLGKKNAKILVPKIYGKPELRMARATSYTSVKG